MVYTKKTNKNSQIRKSDNTKIYILLFLILSLLAIISVGGFYWWSKNPQRTYDYVRELGVKKVNPYAKEVGNFFLNTRDIGKTIERNLNNKNRKEKIKNSTKKEASERLAAIYRKLNEISNQLDQNCSDQEKLTSLYFQIYDRGKELIELREKTADHIPYEQLKNQYFNDQKNWKISDSEKEEIEREVNKWILKWYNKFIQEGLKPEQNERILTEYIKPIIGGQTITNPSPHEITKFKKVFSYWAEDENKIRKHYSVDLRNPLWVKFNGYSGFLDEKDKEASGENSAVLGLTTSPKPSNLDSREFYFYHENILPINIKLKKELFFNRVGNDTWINSLDKNERNYLDISFEQLIETIAHELAHAVVVSLRGEYIGEYDGESGHGKIHDDFTERIEKMMKESPDFSEFKRWWNKR